MRACWLKWVGRDWSISADYIWLNYSDANTMYKTSPAQHSESHTGLIELNLIINLNEIAGCQIYLINEAQSSKWSERR